MLPLNERSRWNVDVDSCVGVCNVDGVGLGEIASLSLLSGCWCRSASMVLLQLVDGSLTDTSTLMRGRLSLLVSLAVFCAMIRVFLKLDVESKDQDMYVRREGPK